MKSTMKKGLILLAAFMFCYLAVGHTKADARSFSEISKRNMIIKKQRYEAAVQKRLDREAARKNAILFRDAERRAKRGVSTLVVNSDGTWTEIRHNRNYLRF